MVCSLIDDDLPPPLDVEITLADEREAATALRLLERVSQSYGNRFTKSQSTHSTLDAELLRPRRLIQSLLRCKLKLKPPARHWRTRRGG